MRTVALRFGEHFAPEQGTIASHQDVIEKLGYVWYGKMGSSVSDAVINDILKQQDAKILLIRSGKVERYWAYVTDIKKEKIDSEGIPEYYRENRDKFSTWFKIKCFEVAPKGIMSKCKIASSGRQLGEVSKHSMSPYFIIDVDE